MDVVFGPFSSNFYIDYFLDHIIKPQFVREKVLWMQIQGFIEAFCADLQTKWIYVHLGGSGSGRHVRPLFTRKSRKALLYLQSKRKHWSDYLMIVCQIQIHNQFYQSCVVVEWKKKQFTKRPNLTFYWSPTWRNCTIWWCLQHWYLVLK